MEFEKDVKNGDKSKVGLIDEPSGETCVYITGAVERLTIIFMIN